MVEPAAAPKVAKLSSKVETLLREAEECDTSSVPTVYRRMRVEVPSKRVLFDRARDPTMYRRKRVGDLSPSGMVHRTNHLANDNINFHRTRVRDQAKTSIYSRAGAWKKIFLIII